MTMNTFLDSLKNNKKKLHDVYGGGTLEYSIQYPNGINVSYKDKNGDINVFFEIKNRKKYWGTKTTTRGEIIMGKQELAKMFENHVINDMMGHYEKHLKNRDPEQQRVLDLTKKINNIKESTPTNVDVSSNIQDSIKPFMNEVYMILDNLDDE